MTESGAAQARVDELDELLAEIDQITGVDAEMVGVDLRRVAGMQAIKTLVLQRLARARQRVAWDEQLGAVCGVPAARPVVLDPGELAAVQSQQGQPLTPVISRPAVATSGLSSAEVWMPPGHAARAHVHYGTDVVVRILYGQASTLWWDADGQMHELAQRAGQHLHIPRGVPHAAVNRHRLPVVAIEVRNSSLFNADNVLLPHLQPLVDEQMAAPTRDHGELVAAPDTRLRRGGAS